MCDYLCYTLLSVDGRCTYVGVTNNLARRLRQHNGVISGGAKCTGREGKRPWSVVCTVTGFGTHVEALQFEWALHHAGKRFGAGLPGRWRKLQHVCAKDRWTSKAPLATERPLVVTVYANRHRLAAAALRTLLSHLAKHFPLCKNKMGADQSRSKPVPATGANVQALHDYLMYLLRHHPARFEQYFADLFMSPASLVWRNPNGFYRLYFDYSGARNGLRTFLQDAQEEARKVPDNAPFLNSLSQRLHDMREWLEQMQALDETMQLTVTFHSFVTLFKTGSEMERQQVKNVDDMFGNYTMFMSMVSLVTALEKVLGQLHAFQHAYTALVQSRFADAAAIQELWKAGAYLLLDRTPLRDTFANDPYSVENLVMNTVDAMIEGWQQFTALPFAHESVPLYSRVLRHLYDHTDYSRGNLMSVALSRDLLSLMHTKLRRADSEVFAQSPPRTAVVFILTHGGIDIDDASFDPMGDTLPPVKKVVPDGLVVTRVTHTVPGSIVYVTSWEGDVKVENIVTQAIAAKPSSVDNPLEFVFSILQELHEERRTQNLDPQDLKKSYGRKRTFPFYEESFMRPHAVTYLPGDEYLHKSFSRSKRERDDHGFGIFVLNAASGHPVDLMNDPGNKTKDRKGKLIRNNLRMDLETVLLMLSTPPYNYNNVILIDQSCNTFSGRAKTFEIVKETSAQLLAQKLLGGWSI